MQVKQLGYISTSVFALCSYQHTPSSLLLMVAVENNCCIRKGIKMALTNIAEGNGRFT
jgi:hypothetical protein